MNRGLCYIYHIIYLLAKDSPYFESFDKFKGVRKFLRIFWRVKDVLKHRRFENTKDRSMLRYLLEKSFYLITWRGFAWKLNVFYLMAFFYWENLPNSRSEIRSLETIEMSFHSFHQRHVTLLWFHSNNQVYRIRHLNSVMNRKPRRQDFSKENIFWFFFVYYWLELQLLGWMCTYTQHLLDKAESIIAK